MKKIAVISGAGISAESGIRTFRDSGGLWENHRVEDVATPNAWVKDPDLVLELYNQRRKQVLEAEPNSAHTSLTDLEGFFDVSVITQNVDNLHERGGSSNVVHLHGLITQARSSVDPSEIIDIDGWELKKGQRCSHGRQLRPNIVWFGEAVPMIGVAAEIVEAADVVIVVGTSLNVYPAAGLMDCATTGTPTFVVDPNDLGLQTSETLIHIKEKAGAAMPRLVKKLIDKYQ